MRKYQIKIGHSLHFVLTIGLSEEAIFSSSNKLQALLKFDFKSAGASFMTLMQDCSNDSGMVLKWGSGGGSADKKQRKSKCDPSAVVSKYQKKDDNAFWAKCKLGEIEIV